MTQTESVATKIGRVAAQANILVIAAISIVAIALAVGFAAQLGLPVWAAICCALPIYFGLLALHVAVLRGRRIAALESEMARLWAALGAEGLSAETGNAARAGGSRVVPQRLKPRPASAAKPADAKGNTNVDTDRRQDRGGTARLAEQFPAGQGARDNGGAYSLADETAMARALAEPDAYNAGAHHGSAEGHSPSQQRAPRSLNASAIHEMVKKLAVESGSVAPADQAFADLDETPAVAAHPHAPAVTGDAITDSVRALRAAADAMRPAAGAAAQQQGTSHAADVDRAGDASAAMAQPAEDLAPDQEERLAALAEALSADRIDVMLEPILGLKDQATRHFEVSVCLRTPDGALLDPNDDRRSLAGTGILPLIDLAKISRIAEVAKRLAERGKTGSVFAGVAGESLGDDDFLVRFSDIYNDRMSITEQLVVSLAQADVRAFAPAHWSMLQELCAVGFRFALEHVTDLDMDFDGLKSANIQYVKLDAEVYLRGLPAGGEAIVPASDVYNFLADKGLSLIVDHIASEAQLMKIVDCGALYGQGKLFGGPRPVKAQVFSAKSAAA